MRKKDLQVARTKTDKEISEAMAKKSAELAASKFKAATGETKNIKVGRNLRREIAQLATILRESSFAKATDDVKGGK